MSLLYVAGRLIKSGTVLGLDAGFAEPLAGVLPVFRTREEAEDFADGAEVFTIAITELSR